MNEWEEEEEGECCGRLDMNIMMNPLNRNSNENYTISTRTSHTLSLVRCKINARPTGKFSLRVQGSLESINCERAFFPSVMFMYSLCDVHSLPSRCSTEPVALKLRILFERVTSRVYIPFSWRYVHGFGYFVGSRFNAIHIEFTIFWMEWMNELREISVMLLLLRKK